MDVATRTIAHFIDGADAAESARTAPAWNPATGEIQAQVALADTATVDRAVAAAARAFPAWAATPPHRRAHVFFEFRNRVRDDIDRLARIITSEHGKTLDDAKAEIARGLDVVEFACGISELLKGDYTAGIGRDIDSWSTRAPLGVCVGITPFNFPAMVPMWMFPIAIACGNTFILKPSERDPSLAIELARLMHESGAPNGVFNVINGDATAVNALLEHNEVAAVSFVGSTPVAKSVYERATQHHKRIQALGGAKNHLVVMPDADPDETTDAIIGAAYGSAGERCMAISVIVPVGNDVADNLVQRLSTRLKDLRIGPGDEPNIDMGPLVTNDHRNRVARYVDIAESEGATIVEDGRTLQTDRGFFFGPTLLDNVEPHMRSYKEEIFGPVLAVVRANTLDEAIAIVSEHEYGNGASIFTSDGAAANKFESEVNAGMIGINIAIPVPMAFHSFGGWKASLFGDHHIHGTEGVRFYTKQKTVTARWSAKKAATSFSMPTHK